MTTENLTEYILNHWLIASLFLVGALRLLWLVHRYVWVVSKKLVRGLEDEPDCGCGKYYPETRECKTCINGHRQSRKMKFETLTGHFVKLPHGLTMLIPTIAFSVPDMEISLAWLQWRTYLKFKK
jgi:hypothetical protein